MIFNTNSHHYHASLFLATQLSLAKLLARWPSTTSRTHVENRQLKAFETNNWEVKANIYNQTNFKMLVSSGIMEQVKWSMDQIRKWNPIRIQSAYTLQSSKTSPACKRTKGAHTLCYKFESNLTKPGRHWFHHAFILGLTVISGLFQILFEDQFIDQLAVHVFVGSACTVVIIMAYQ